ncbi:hypothetical protein SMICM17S_11578 [Streptomyces microflavus]
MVSRSTTSVLIAAAPSLAYWSRYLVRAGSPSGATSTCLDCRAVRNWVLGRATSWTSLFFSPAAFRARRTTTPWAWPWEKPIFLPRKSSAEAMSEPGAVAKV